MIPYSEAKCLITTAVFEDDAIAYVKGCGKRMWNLLLDERERMYIETLDSLHEHRRHGIFPSGTNSGCY